MQFLAIASIHSKSVNGASHRGLIEGGVDVPTTEPTVIRSFPHNESCFTEGLVMDPTDTGWCKKLLYYTFPFVLGQVDVHLQTISLARGDNKDCQHRAMILYFLTVETIAPVSWRYRSLFVTSKTFMTEKVGHLVCVHAHWSSSVCTDHTCPSNRKFYPVLTRKYLSCTLHVRNRSYINMSKYFLAGLFFQRSCMKVADCTIKATCVVFGYPRERYVCSWRPLQYALFLVCQMENHTHHK